MKINSANVHFTEQTKTPYTIGILVEVGNKTILVSRDEKPEFDEMYLDYENDKAFKILSPDFPTSLRGEVKLKCMEEEDLYIIGKNHYQLIEPLQIVEEEKAVDLTKFTDKESVEEAAKEYSELAVQYIEDEQTRLQRDSARLDFIAGAKWQASQEPKKDSEELMYPKSFIEWLHGMTDQSYTERMFDRWKKETPKQ